MLFLILGHFLPFYPTNSQKNQNLEKMKKKKCLEISSFYIFVPKIMIRWCTVPEIWYVTDVIIFYFGPFFALLPCNSPKNQNFEKMKNTLDISSFYICVPKIMIRWCTVPEIWCVTDVIVISHFGLFFALLPPKSPKTQNFEKMKKTPKDIIILHTWTKNYDQKVYGSWDMLRDRRTDGRKKWHIEVGAPPKNSILLNK